MTTNNIFLLLMAKNNIDPKDCSPKRAKHLNQFAMAANLCIGAFAFGMYVEHDDHGKAIFFTLLLAALAVSFWFQSRVNRVLDSHLTNETGGPSRE